MKDKVIILIVFAIFLVGCQSEETVEPIFLKGDIETWNSIEDTKEPIDPIEWIEGALPTYDSYDLMVKSRDGFCVKMTGDSLEGTSISYDPSTGWAFLSDHHPVNSGAKWISEVIVVKKEASEPNFSRGLNVIQNNSDSHVSLGQLLTMDYSIRYNLDGTTEQSGNAIDVMKEVRYFPLSTFVDDAYKWLLVMDYEGNHHYLAEGDYFVELQVDRINLRASDGKIIKNIVGLIVDPPEASVMDNYYDAMTYLDKDIPVMTVFIDGFSYNQWTYIKSNYQNLYLSSLPFARATTVFKPVTNASFAAMISGQPPAVNGIMDRSGRQPLCDTIFDHVESGILVDGLVKILDVPCDLYLENDMDGDGYTDLETFEKASAVLGGTYILVHFNGVDDAGHDFGPFGDETIEKILEVDGYVKQLVEKWHGKVIIVADHGMHETADGGDHGEFRTDDLMMPYILTDGGLYDQTN